MMNKGRILGASLVLAAALAVMTTGCGQKLSEKETETEKKTEAVTEAMTEAVYVVQTEPVTEPPTEPETETETETEAITERRDLSQEEELAAETDYPVTQTFYAMDDINVRMQPSTESDDTVISSFDQGQEITVTGETPNWYIVALEDDAKGYVHKDNLSETVVEPKSEEERAQIMDQAAQDGAMFNVQTFAEAFTGLIGSDANMRTEPGENGEIITTLSEDTTVMITGETDEWYQVTYEGTTGYISKGLFK